jgi:hypothetical protein
MTLAYVHHRIVAAPRRWRDLAERLAANAGPSIYGIWRSQIGRPRDELTAITVWPEAISAATAERRLVADAPDILSVVSETLQPTLRPDEPTPPRRQGNYAFRWFATPEPNWAEFLDLCAQAWPGFEAAYDSQVIGLWRATGDRTGPPADGSPDSGVRSLLLTRRPDLAMWERSKLPQGAAETAVRDALSRRYDLCTWTVVCTTTLLTAADRDDRARWA